jgi:hypothetical protein
MRLQCEAYQHTQRRSLHTNTPGYYKGRTITRCSCLSTNCYNHQGCAYGTAPRGYPVTNIHTVLLCLIRGHMHIYAVVLPTILLYIHTMGSFIPHTYTYRQMLLHLGSAKGYHTHDHMHIYSILTAYISRAPTTHTIHTCLLV